MGVKVGLCIMAKHEANTIEKAVESCRPYVDHIIISVDSKSEDGTYDIARKIADTVLTHEFETEETPHGSFARIRNGYLKAAKEAGLDWVVHLDGHEYVKFIGTETFHNLVEKDSSVESYYMNLDMNGTFVRQLRFSKVKDNIKFGGDIHNFLSGYNKEGISQQIVFVHDRSEQPSEHVQQRTEQRTMMSEKILQERIDINPKDSRAMFYLAQSHKETGKFEEAIELFYRYLTVSVFVPERWNARNYLYHCLKKVGRNEEAYKVIEGSFDEPPRAEAWIILGDKAYEEKDFSKSVVCYENATKIPRPTSVVFIDETAYTWFSWDKLSMAYHNNKQFIEAIRAAGNSLKGCPPDNHVKRIGNNIVFWSDQVEQKENKE